MSTKKHPLFNGTVSKETLQKQLEFDEVKVRHRKLSAVLDDLRVALMPSTQSSIIAVTGATGVGKSTLAKKLLSSCAEYFAPELASDKSAIPFVGVEAYANGENRHSFKPIFQDLLDQLLEPGVDRKAAINEVDGRLIVNYRKRDTIALLRKSLESALKLRKTKVCVIDEAYHLLRLGRDAAVMDTLKSLANTTGVKLVLVGSFDLFDLVSNHGQVARRMTLINFDRYHADNKQDREEFRSIVGALTERWPCEEVPNLAAIADELLEITFGCVGLLKSLMLEALSMQLLHNGKWKTDFLAKAAKANALRRVIRREIEAGEARVQEATLGQSLWDKTALRQLEAKMEGRGG